MPNIVLTRIDNRLIHGQVATMWSSSVGANITNGAELVEFLEQQGGMGSCTDDLSCVNEIAGSYLSISLTQSQYNDIIDVDGSPIFNYGRFIDDFKNFIKGE